MQATQKFNSLAPNGQSSPHNLLDIEQAVIPLETYLLSRDWFINYASDIDRAKAQIAVIEKDLIEALLRKLHRAKAESDLWAANDQYDLSGKHLNISQAERRAAQTDSDQIGSVIDRLTEFLEAFDDV